MKNKHVNYFKHTKQFYQFVILKKIMAPSLNLETFNKAVFEFEQWESAWDSHRSKNDLKVKVKIGE